MSGKTIVITVLSVLSLASLNGCQTGINVDRKMTANLKKTQSINITHSMKLSSPNFENNGPMPTKYTCQGLDISPQLDISDVPEDAQSLALIIEDPDAPMGTWTHWVVWNIPADTKVIPENAGSKFAVQGNNSWPKQAYGGPCPPNGSHRYFFKLYALSETLDIPATSTKTDLQKAMEGLIIDEAQYMGTYKKS